MPPRIKSLKRTTVEPAWSVTLTVPVVVRSEMNLREHWAARHRRFKEQAQVVWQLWAVFGLTPWTVPMPCRVTLTKLGGKGLDTDNLAGAFKGVRDFLASGIFGIDDADGRVTWRYAQNPGGPSGVRITLESVS